MAKMTYQERKHLKSSSFVFPKERRYPIQDIRHGRNALARVSAFGSPSEKAKVRRAVHRKFPSIGKARGGEIVHGEGERPKHRADRARR